MSDMIERVAKAISKQQGFEVDEAGDWSAWHWEECYEQAKAAIEAMRDLVKCDPEGNAMDNMYLNSYIDRVLKE